MTKYILEPKPIAKRCFLLEALYWVAFSKYPTTDIDIKADNLEELLEFQDDYENSLPMDYEWFFTPEFCLKHSLPTNPEVENTLNGEDTYHDNDFYEKMLEALKDNSEAIESLKKEQMKAVPYNKKKDVFETALYNFLDVYKSKLYIALKEGKIKAFGLEGLKEYIYDGSTRDIFDDENCYKAYPDIEYGDTFWAYNYSWQQEKAVEIPKEYWLMDDIDWNSCIFNHKEQRYVYVQLEVEDLFNVFPEINVETRTLKYVAGSYILEGDNLDMAMEKRGRKPKANYDELTIDFIKNITSHKEQKLESVIAYYQDKYPQIGRTTLVNKLSPLLKAVSQK